MKKLIAAFIISMMVVPPGAFAVERKPCIECSMKTNAAQEEKIVRTCNDVSDIICKDVKASDRRGCSESDEYMFSKNTSKMDLFNFAKGCFKSGVTSFVQFFTDFIPELLKGIWEATKTVGSLAVNSVTGEGPGLWSKLKGMYESTTSVAADIYEAVQENPGAYFDKIWTKIVDVAGPMVANYDCLKPQKKVENICGLVTEWVVPPAMLAKILVRGIKEVKFLQKTGAFSMTASGKLAKALEFAEKRSVFTLKEIQEMEGKFKVLGYSSDDFALLYKSGALEKVKLSQLKAVSTTEGKLQRLELLGETKGVSAPKKIEGIAKPKHTELNLTTDFITTTKKGPKGETFIANGQIMERIVQEGKEVGYRVRLVEDKTGRVFETTYKAEDLAAMNAKPSTQAVADRVAAAVQKDAKHMSPEEEFLALQRKQELEHARVNAPDNLATIEVHETGMEEFVAAQKAITEKEAHAKALREAAHKPPKVDGLDVDEIGLDVFHQAKAENKILAVKKQEQEVARIKAVHKAEDDLIKDKGVVEHDGLGVEEIHPDDPRFKEHFTGISDTPVKYKDGIDYVPTESPGLVVRNSERTPTPAKPLKVKDGKVLGPFTSDYIQVLAQDSMGVMNFMPAQVVRRVLEKNQAKYVLRMLDKASNTYKERIVSASELRLTMKAKVSPNVEKELKEFNRQTGFHDDFQP